jgi:hypothetical protein
MERMGAVVAGKTSAPQEGTIRRPAWRSGKALHAKQSAGDTDPRMVKLLTRVAVVVTLAMGLAFRIWLIFHAPINSDEAVVGLMAIAGLHGHFNAFYLGQVYGGTAETELTSLFFAVIGRTVLAAQVTVVFLSGLCAFLTWRITLRLVPWRSVAAMTGALVWAAPLASVSLSVLFYGFRGVTLACGLFALLLALRILDGQRSLIDFGSVGVAIGVGWWSSPEIVYYLIPTGLILIGAVVKSTRPRWRMWIPRTALALIAIVVGALPWLWANFHSHFASLQTANFASAPSDFESRLDIFYRFVFPTELGVRRGNDLGWIAATLGSWSIAALTVLVVVLLVVTLVLCIARGGRYAAIGLTVLAFPYIYAISPASSVFANARYGVFLPPLLAMVLAVGLCEAVQMATKRGARRPARGADEGPVVVRSIAPAKTLAVASVTMASVVAATLLFSGVTFSQEILQPHAYTPTWGNPNGASVEAVQQLERGGVSAGYADYWVAYKLDFLSENRLVISPIGDDTIRSASIEAEALGSKHTAWLFVPPDKADAGASQFSSPALTVGPDGVSKGWFLERLHRLGVRYRIIPTGVLDAVVPDQTVTPSEFNLPGVVRS